MAAAEMIWKQQIGVAPLQTIKVPQGAVILCAACQNDVVCLWYHCDSKAPQEDRTILVCGTGHQAPEDARYIGTAFMAGGKLVWHVFEGVSS